MVVIGVLFFIVVELVVGVDVGLRLAVFVKKVLEVFYVGFYKEKKILKYMIEISICLFIYVSFKYK